MSNVNTASYRDNLQRTTLNRSGSLIPTVNNSFDLGSSSLNWRNIYVTSVTGSLFGTSSRATSASYADFVQNSITSVSASWVSSSTNVKYYGALGDGVTDDTTAFQTALNRSNCVYIPSGSYVVSNLYPRDRQCIYGDGPSSYLIFKTGSTGYLFDCYTASVNLSNFEVDGLSNTARPTVEESRSCIHISASVTSSRFDNLIIHGFNSVGIGINGHTVERGDLPSITNCGIFYCFRGIDTAVSGNLGGEYLRIANCSFHKNSIGVKLGSGNVTVTNCGINENTDNLYLTNTGGNEGHGSIVGCTINHAASRSFVAENIRFGMNIMACHFFFGDMLITGSNAINFVGNTLAPQRITASRNTGINKMTNNWFFISANSSASIFRDTNDRLYLLDNWRSDTNFLTSSNDAYSGSFYGTSSWAQNTVSSNTATSASWSSVSISSSFLNGTATASLFGTSSNSVSSSNSVTSSYSISASKLTTDTNAFVQGGNAFGTTAILGTTDSFPINIRTRGTTAVIIQPTGSGWIGIGQNPTTNLDVISTDTGSIYAASIVNFRTGSSVGYCYGMVVSSQPTTNNARSVAGQFIAYNLNNAVSTQYLASIDARSVILGTASVSSPTTVYGVLSTVVVQDTGSVTAPIYNISSQTSFVGSGSVDTYAAFFSRIRKLSTPVSNSIGLYLESTESDINSYGIFIEPLTGSTRYAIYQSGRMDRNFFGGNVGFGTSSPDTFTIQTTGSVGPNSTNVSDLGSSALQWRNVYATSFSGSLFGTASNSVSSTTSSFALNSNSTTLVTGSTYQITSSWSNNSISSSFASNGPFTTLVTSSTYQITSSWSDNATSASYAVSASKLTSNTNAFIQGGNAFGVGGVFGTTDENTMTLRANAISAMTIATNGFVGVSTSSPTANLTVIKNDTSSIYAVDITTFRTGSSGFINGASIAVSPISHYLRSIGLTITNTVNNNAAPSSYAVGIDCRSQIIGNQSASLLMGIQGILQQQQTGSITSTSRCFSAQSNFLGSGSIGTVYGYFYDVRKQGCTVTTTNAFRSDFNIATTNAYGIYLNPTTASTLRYGIYQLGAFDHNYFQGTISGTLEGTSSNLRYVSITSDATTGNIAIGDGAAATASNASFSTIIGDFAGNRITTDATSTVLIGTSAGWKTDDVSFGTYLGTSAGASVFFGSRATLLGFGAGNFATTASSATMVGFQAGRNAENAPNSVFVGYQAGYNAYTGSFSTFIGYQADTVSESLAAVNSIAIGYDAKVSGSNMCVIGGTGSNAVKVSIGGRFARNTLDVIGNISCSVVTASLLGSASYCSLITCSKNVGSGADYSLTQTSTNIGFAQTILPGAGTYLVTAQVQFVGTTSGDEVRAKIRASNGVDITVEPMANIPATNAKVAMHLTSVATITGSVTASIFARNVTAARGVVSSSLSSINYIRLR